MRGRGVFWGDLAISGAKHVFLAFPTLSVVGYLPLHDKVINLDLVA